MAEFRGLARCSGGFARTARPLVLSSMSGTGPGPSHTSSSSSATQRLPSRLSSGLSTTTGPQVSGSRTSHPLPQRPDFVARSFSSTSSLEARSPRRTAARPRNPASDSYGEPSTSRYDHEGSRGDDWHRGDDREPRASRYPTIDRRPDPRSRPYSLSGRPPGSGSRNSDEDGGWDLRRDRLELEREKLQVERERLRLERERLRADRERMAQEQQRETERRKAWERDLFASLQQRTWNGQERGTPEPGPSTGRPPDTTEPKSRKRAKTQSGSSPPPTSTQALNGQVSSLPDMPGPVRTHEQIMRELGKGELMPGWNPDWHYTVKSALGDYCVAVRGPGKVVYDVQQAMVDGEQVWRATVVTPGEHEVIGVGDDRTSKEAQKLAALSALLQLSSAGAFDGEVKKSTSNEAPVRQEPVSEAAIAAEASSTTKDSSASESEPQHASIETTVPVAEETAERLPSITEALDADEQAVDTGALPEDEGGATAIEGQTEPTSSIEEETAVKSSTERTVTLTDGSTLSYEMARHFLSYYCELFRYGLPDVQCSMATVKSRDSTASTTSWEAVLSIQGFSFGSGTAWDKKGAIVNCYLDASRELADGDPDLWHDFLAHARKKGTNHPVGLAPDLPFKMPKALREDIAVLNDELERSILYQNAPMTNVSVESTAPAAAPPAFVATSEIELERKSLLMEDRLSRYRRDPAMRRIRQERQNLPIYGQVDEILHTIAANDVTIVTGRPGSGKTTQIPQLILDDWTVRNRGADCNVLCTQGRRLASVWAAERVAAERGQAIGDQVGYQIRFDLRLPKPDGSITFCTPTTLLQRLQRALGIYVNEAAFKELDSVTHIIVDEVQDREIDVDLLLVVLKRFLADRKARNKPVKIVLLSTGADTALLQRYFADTQSKLAAAVEVECPIQLVRNNYLDDVVSDLQDVPKSHGGWVFGLKDVRKYLDEELSGGAASFTAGSGIDNRVPCHLVALFIAHAMRHSHEGDVLVFLPGWNEIKQTKKILLRAGKEQSLFGLRFDDTSRFEILSLHSHISHDKQLEVYQPPTSRVRRIVLATNIAETCMTIPNIAFVVDSARHKELLYDAQRGTYTHAKTWVSATNLQQRSERAGRFQQGEYFSVVSTKRMAALDLHQAAAINKACLSKVIMRIKAYNLGSVKDVLAAMIEPPSPAHVEAELKLVRRLGALDEDDNLTPLGRVLHRAPLQPELGKLLLYSCLFRCFDAGLTLAAVASNPFMYMPPDAVKQRTIEESDTEWHDILARSDQLVALETYRPHLGKGQTRRQNGTNSFPNERKKLEITRVRNIFREWLYRSGAIAASSDAGSSITPAGLINVPDKLNDHGESQPVLAGLVTVSCAPKIMIRTSGKLGRTEVDKTVAIHTSSVNFHKRELPDPAKSLPAYNPLEKRLYAYGTSLLVSDWMSVQAHMIPKLLDVTRINPLTYLLFGAHKLDPIPTGIECDEWLPIKGDKDALYQVQMLRERMDRCFLRVFEGLSEAYRRGNVPKLERANAASYADEGDEDSDDEDDVAFDDENGPVVEGGEEEDLDAVADGLRPEFTELVDTEVGHDGIVRRRIIEPLSEQETHELEEMVNDVARILEEYASQREDPKGRRDAR